MNDINQIQNQYQNQPSDKFFYSTRKYLFIALSIILGIFLLLLFLFSPIIQQRPLQPRTIPIPTNISSPKIPYGSKPVFVTGKTVRNIHWLNNSDVAFSFFDTTSKRIVIGKGNGVKNEILLNREEIKIPTFFWSSNSYLLILDNKDPNQTYLYSPDGTFKMLEIKGHGYSWSPDGTIFFYEETARGNSTIKEYNILTNTITSINTTPPFFLFSYWSPDGKKILLFDFSEDSSTTKLYTLHRDTKIIDDSLKKSAWLPLWSPQGDAFTYLADNHLYLNKSGRENPVYTTSDSIQFISYGWINKSELLLFDSAPTKPLFFKVNVSTQKVTPLQTQFEFQNNQRLEIVASPDSSQIAIGSEKNGLWIMKL